MAMKAETAKLAEEFFSEIRKRLEAGEQQYGNISFERPLSQILGEMTEEALDVPGWGVIAFHLWTQLKRAKGLIERMER